MKKQKYTETYYFRYPVSNQKEFGLPAGFSITIDQIRAGVKPKWHQGLTLDAFSLADKAWKRSTTGKISVHDNYVNPKDKKFDEHEFFLFKLSAVAV